MRELDTTIVPADRAYRRRVFGAFLCLAILAAASLWALHGAFLALESLAEADPAAAVERLRALVNLISLGNAAVSAALCIWFFALAHRTLRSGQYPPPGLRVLRDTRLRTGPQSRVMAFRLVAFALIILSGNGVLWYLRRVVYSLQG